MGKNKRRIAVLEGECPRHVTCASRPPPSTASGAVSDMASYFVLAISQNSWHMIHIAKQIFNSILLKKKSQKRVDFGWLNRYISCLYVKYCAGSRPAILQNEEETAGIKSESIASQYPVAYA